jgi:hypothetical protein
LSPNIYYKTEKIAIPAKPACHPHFITTKPITIVANNEPVFIPIENTEPLSLRYLLADINHQPL